MRGAEPLDMAPWCRIFNGGVDKPIAGPPSGIGRALAHHFAPDGYELELAARGLLDDLDTRWRAALFDTGRLERRCPAQSRSTPGPS